MNNYQSLKNFIPHQRVNLTNDKKMRSFINRKPTKGVKKTYSHQILSNRKLVLQKSAREDQYLLRVLATPNKGKDSTLSQKSGHIISRALPLDEVSRYH